MKRRQNKSGFTLVELMVVAIIVAVLAAVAIPLMSANKKRAMATEAQAGLGTMRSQIRAMYAETDRYDVDINGDTINNGAAATDIPGILADDLDGRFFSEQCYSIRTVGDTNYVFEADGSVAGGNDAPKAADVDDIVIIMDEQGTFTYESGL